MTTLVSLPGGLKELRDDDGQIRTRKVFVKDLCLDMFIGVYESEKTQKQSVLFNVELETVDRNVAALDDLDAVVCYQEVVDQIKTLGKAGHTHLVETLAERVAEAVLAHKDVLSARIRVEKPDAVKEAGAVGIEIIRYRQDYMS